MSRIISMSLYGNIDMYLHGAIANVALCQQYYPGWEMVVYASESVPELKCQQVQMGPSLEHSGMFWRFLPIWEDHDAVIVRDTDSRLNSKEAAAVTAWLQDGRTCHSMHDHEHHRCYPLFGGMFGMRCGRIMDLTPQLIQEFNRPQKRVADMEWLRSILWPHIEHDTLHHTSVPIEWPSEPFPLTEDGYFVGQQHTEQGAITP